ncbi:hypothetical protein [Streptomyces sp. ScaeMP-e83]|uniref:hypothetical protein n=1 Tax=Streptomyces sp. ScaeMP-e83 TaxID=1758151 RepID=UPI00159F2D16|nr:hypothetical protein [Streptomyces sp. ScaeMP-e83]
MTLSAPNAQDYVALAEIELCGELMIAASAAREERLSPDRIDEVLNVGDELLGTVRAGGVGGSGGVGGARDAGGSGGAGTGVDSGGTGTGTGVDDVLLGSDTEAAWTTVPRQATHPQAAHTQAAHPQGAHRQTAHRG